MDQGILREEARPCDSKQFRTLLKETHMVVLGKRHGRRMRTAGADVVFTGYDL